MAFIFYNSAVAQNTISFKGQVLDNQYRPQTNFRLTVNNQNGVITDNAGIFLVHLLKGSTHLRIISAQDNYVILYPPGGYLAVPRDLKDVVPVIAGSEKDVPFVNEYLALHQLKNKERVETQDTLPVTRKMDSLKNLLIKLRFSEPTLQTLEKLRDDKDMSRSRISADLIDYINKAFEFKNAFKYSAPYAFNNASATEQLKKAVSSYNTIFNKLDTLRETYEKLLRENWRDDSITSSFHELIENMLRTSSCTQSMFRRYIRWKRLLTGSVNTSTRKIIIQKRPWKITSVKM